MPPQVDQSISSKSGDSPGNAPQATNTGQSQNITPLVQIIDEQIIKFLSGMTPVPVAFPFCTDVLLALNNPTTTPPTPLSEVMSIFYDYFEYGDYNVYQAIYPRPPLDEKLIGSAGALRPWPPSECLPNYHVCLKGRRRMRPITTSPAILDPRIKRLFLADLVWLFYYDRMGIFEMLNIILHDVAMKGKLPIQNNDYLAIILEGMIRATKMGLHSSARDRNSSYRRCLSWSTTNGIKLNLETEKNNAFNSMFHKFIQNALEYYKEKRLREAINATGSAPSMETLSAIGENIKLLYLAFDPFNYGRNYALTLSGIVWNIAGIAMIRELKSFIGIPTSFTKPEQYIPAAYDLLVLNRSITPSEVNRWKAHKNCAEYSRNILLDIEFLGQKDSLDINTEIKPWLDLVEREIEGYRSAYQILIGANLGLKVTEISELKIEQRV